MRNLDDISEEQLPIYDVCIIGTGPAGITTCVELADAKNIRLCILESGGLHTSERGNKLRKIESLGISIKDYSRERVLGGASITWSGLSAPLDRIDMSERPYVRVSGWPISYEELEPYWRAAAKRYRFPSLGAYEEFGNLRRESDIHPKWRDINEKIFLAAAEPQRFAKEFRSHLALPNVDLLYNATVLRLENYPTSQQASHAVVMSKNGAKFLIHSRVFILAAGGIENARLLLASRLGNEHDQVGRYFMNHPKNSYGLIVLKKPIQASAYFFGCLKSNFAGYAGLQLTPEIQRRSGILNSYVRFEPLFRWSNNKGVEASIFLFKRLKFLLSVMRKVQFQETMPLRDYAETGDDTPLQNDKKIWCDWFSMFYGILSNMPAVTAYAYSRLLLKHPPAITQIRLRIFMEMEPRPGNRVILGSKRDIYGQPIPVVWHETSELDRRSLTELHKTLAIELKENDLGELQSNLHKESSWPIAQDASHHMGATRMGKDPKTSVVNEQLRLHNVENVYCVGGSVFPTSGCANPTFTICALSIRLAEHIKKILST